ncbi:Coiled-coil and C2 domain-containing protein 2A, partial [Durusdinium trenchii]
MRQAVAFRAQVMLWRFLSWLTDPEAWLEPMFLGNLEVASFYGAGELGAEGESTDWMIREDGLFRSSGNVNSTEPWNRERLHLQLERSLWAKEAAGSDELRADEARELLSPGLAVAKLAPEGIHWLNKLGVRFRSQVKSKRRHLVASQLYELRLDICRVSLFRSPAYRDLARGISPLEALDGREHRAAGELQELYHRYLREMEGDLVVQLDQRLDALVEHGKILRSTLYEEESRPVVPGGVNAALSAARDAYRSHLQERQKLRVRRDEKESHLDELCKNLYGKWRELRQIRQDYGFTSTVWRLIAQVQEHDAATDGARKARNVEAEIEEVSYLQGLPVDQLRDRLLKKWDTTKRSPGMASYRFDLTANAALTSAEVLRSRAYDGLVTEAEAVLAQEELQRRKLAARVRVCVECRVQNRVVGCSPSIPLCLG